MFNNPDVEFKKVYDAIELSKLKETQDQQKRLKSMRDRNRQGPARDEDRQETQEERVAFIREAYSWSARLSKDPEMRRYYDKGMHEGVFSFPSACLALH